MLKVMFLCTGNSCRSQMAEGLARAWGAGLVEPRSAGLMAAGVNPHAVAVMNEIGIDITSQWSKVADPALLASMDVVVTLCVHAEISCPATPPGVRRLHWPINDPVRKTGSEEVVLQEFRRARDEIGQKVKEFLGGIDRS